MLPIPMSKSEVLFPFQPSAIFERGDISYSELTSPTFLSIPE